jgi:hypothetical protein
MFFVAPFVAQDIDKAAKKDNGAAERVTARVRPFIRVYFFASDSTIVNLLQTFKVRRH